MMNSDPPIMRDPAPAQPAPVAVQTDADTTNTPPALAILALPADGEQPSPFPLPLAADGSGECRLTCLPGAEALMVVLTLDGQPCLRAEVRARAGETVTLRVQLDGEGEPLLSAGAHRVLFLPLDMAYDPAPPLPAPLADAPWDICLIIDATMRTDVPLAPQGGPQAGRPVQPPAGADAAPGASAAGPAAANLPGMAPLGGLLLQQPKAWAAVLAPLLELLETLAGPDGCRLALIAFGDEPQPQGINAPDLGPAYVLRHLPADREPYQLLALAPEALRQLLSEGLSASSGGDFVDALADALAAAAELQWHDDANRLLVLVGDSPGHSSSEPVPHGGDLRARRHDLDAEALRLQQARVQLLTLYHPPSADAIDAAGPLYRGWFDYPRKQYRRLASAPALACTTTDFAPREVSDWLNTRTTPLARGVGWGRSC